MTLGDLGQDLSSLPAQPLIFQQSGFVPWAVLAGRGSRGAPQASISLPTAQLQS